MKKILHKIKTWFMVFLVLFSLSKEEKVKADASILGGSYYFMSLSTLNPAIIPIAIIGVVACLLVGYTISNWDEITAFGGKVADELVKMGYSVSDFVSGTSVKINSTFKNAVKKAASSTGDSLPAYYKNNIAYTGQIQTAIGMQKSTNFINLVYINNTSSEGMLGVVIGNPQKGYFDEGFAHARYIDKSRYIYTPTLTISVTFDPIPANRDWRLVVDGAPQLQGKKNYETLTNSNGDVIGFSGFYDLSNMPARRTRIKMTGKTTNLNITGVSIKELNINKTSGSIPTLNLKNGAISSNAIDEYIGTAFPGDETVTLDVNADLAGTSVLSLPEISDKTLAPPTIDRLNDIRAKARTRTRGLDEATTSTGAGTLDNTGWLSGLLDWLRKLLEAIKALPGLIAQAFIDFFDKLWEWLKKIWTAITGIPGAILTGIRDILRWLFGVEQAWLQGQIQTIKGKFEAKFPPFPDFSLVFREKSTLSNMNMVILGMDLQVADYSMINPYLPRFKSVLSALIYVSTGLFLYRSFYKVAED